jgi:hypothetical protein
MKKKLMSRNATRWTIRFLCLFLVAVAYTAITWAGPPVGVTATLIGRSTFGRFKVKTPSQESAGEHNKGQVSLDFMAQAKPGMDNPNFRLPAWIHHGMAHAPRTGLHQCDQWSGNLLRVGRSDLYSESGHGRSGLRGHGARAHRSQRDRVTG